MIAMALACRPKLLLADEPTTALDVTLRGQILDLLGDLQQRYGMAVLLITHDLNLVRKFADRVAVMEDGWLVEQGSVANVFGNPQHPYTRKLIESRPAREIEEAPHKSLEPVMRASELRVKYPIPIAGNPRLVQEGGVRRGEERRLCHCPGADPGRRGRIGLRQIHVGARRVGADPVWR